MAQCLNRTPRVWVLILTCWAISRVYSEDVRCDPKKPYCPSAESTCDMGKCTCNSGYGNGHLACHNEHEEYCHIINDPVAITYGREWFDLPLPCRFLAAHVSADRRYERFIVSQCHTKVFGINGRSRGKFYVRGTDVVVQYLAAANDDDLHEIHFRIAGTVTDQGYEFDLSLKYDVDDWSPFLTNFDLEEVKSLLGGEVKFEVDNGLNRAILHIENCGLTLLFRPANGILGINQEWMPGLAIAYDKRELDLKWWVDEKPMCLTPDMSKYSTGRVANEARLNPSHAFLWRALYTPAAQTIEYPDDTHECGEVINTVQKCTDFEMHVEAMQMCSFILEKPLFVNCISEFAGERFSSNTAMALYEVCLKAFCLKSNSLCHLVHKRIETANCIKFTYDGFLEHACNFEQIRPPNTMTMTAT